MFKDTGGNFGKKYKNAWYQGWYTAQNIYTSSYTVGFRLTYGRADDDTVTYTMIVSGNSSSGHTIKHDDSYALNSSLANIGTYSNGSYTTSTSISAATTTNITSFDLSAGTYVVCMRGVWSAITAAGRYGICISTSSASWEGDKSVMHYATSAQTADVVLDLSIIVKLTSSDTLYLNAYAQGGGTFKSAYWRIVRII